MTTWGQKYFPAGVSMDDPREHPTMTIAWLKGGIEDLPYHLGPPADETSHIKSDLIHMNNLGFITESSQPGLKRGVVLQRAYVHGVAEASRAHRWAAAAIDAGFWAWVWSCDGYIDIDYIDPSHRQPVTASDGRQTTWLPLGLESDILRQPRWLQLAILDPQWGRTNGLFNGNFVLPQL